MRRTLSLLLALLLLCPAALAETFYINYDGTEESPGYALLLTDGGTALTPAKTYASIYPLNPGATPETALRYQAEPMGLTVEVDAENLDDLDYVAYHRVALLADDGRQLTGFDYCALNALSDGNFAFSVYDGEQTRTGVMDPEADVLVAARYMDIQPLGEGRWLALKPKENDQCSLTLVDADGTETDLALTTNYTWLSESAGAPCVVDGIQEYDGESVFIDRDGKVCFDRSFQQAGGFYGNYAAVEVDGAMMLIDREGKPALDGTYQYLYHGFGTPDALFIAERDAQIWLIDARTGEIVMEHDFSPCSYVSGNLNTPGYLWVYTDTDDYLFRIDGTLVGSYSEADASYQLVGGPDKTPRILKSTGEWPESVYQLYDLEGRPVGRGYDGMTADLTRNGTARYVFSNAETYVNAEGETMLDWQSYRYGVMDENGRELLPALYYNYILVLSPDRYWVTGPDQAGMSDSQGHWYYAISNYEELMD